MSEQKDNKLVLIDAKGNETVCEIIFTYASEATGKNYVVFRVEGDESGEVGAAAYVEEGEGQGRIEPIETEEEWVKLEEIFKQFTEEQAQNKSCCGGCNGDCEGDCNCEDCHCDDENCECDGQCCCENKEENN